MTELRIRLHRWGILQVSVPWVNRQSTRNREGALIFALQYGRYDVRAAAAGHLQNFSSAQTLEALTLALDDGVELVSQAAIHAMEKMELSFELKQRIDEKRAFWQVYNERAKARMRAEKHYVPDRKDRPSKLSYDNLKKMLMKPMNMGKWF